MAFLETSIIIMVIRIISLCKRSDLFGIIKGFMHLTKKKKKNKKNKKKQKQKQKKPKSLQ